MTKEIILTAITIITINLSACSSQSNDAHTVVYNTSVDVPLHHWTSADTLFFPLTVTEEPNLKLPICTNKDYHLRLSFRHAIDFPLTAIPSLFCMQQTDTVQGQSRVTRRVFQQTISPKVRDEKGQPLGTGWGSLYEYQQDMPEITVRFDQPGNYRFLFIPSFRGVTDGISGMASVGIELFE